MEELKTSGGLLAGRYCGAATVEVWQFLKRVNIELLYDPEIPLLGRYSKY